MQFQRSLILVGTRMALSSKQRYQKERTKLTRNRLGKEIATVLVGEDEETFPVHHDLIAASSDFFNKALNGRFAEKNDTVKLQKVNVTVFGRYLQWLCEGRIFIAENVDRVAVQDWDDILDLLILGNLLQDNQFFNAVTDHLIDLSDRFRRYPAALASKAYSELPPSHPFLQLLVDFWVFARNQKWLDTPYEEDETTVFKIAWDREHGPIEHWTRIAMGLMIHTESKHGSYPWQVDRCRYHQHEDGELWCN